MFLYLYLRLFQPPIFKLQEDNASLKRDQMKFTSVIVHNRAKVEKYKEAVKTLMAEIATQGEFLLLTFIELSNSPNLTQNQISGS